MTCAGFKCLSEPKLTLKEIEEITNFVVDSWNLSERRTRAQFFGYVPNYPPPLFDLIEGNENKIY